MIQLVKKLSLVLLFPSVLSAQVFHFNENDLNHRTMLDDRYLIETAYHKEDGKFAFTRGGIYQKKGRQISVAFEFNSAFEKDSLKAMTYTQKDWVKVSKKDQALEGKWLMAGRVKPEGEQRRDLTRSRKTMKLLLDGHFQWTAFDTASMRFIASGGGTYTAENGAYVETLEYFSRDNSRVGKVLPFEFIQKEDDWYHKGRNSKGQPMHEIWHKITNQ